MTKDTLEAWKTLESKVLLDHPRIKVVEDLVQLPNGHVTSYLRLDSASNAVTVICIRDGQILMQREYSHPPGEVLLQFPGGKIEGNETPEQAAVRELREELGFTFSQCENLGWYYTNNRRSNSKMYAVLAREVAPTEKVGGDVEEYIDLFWIPAWQAKRNDRRAGNNKLHRACGLGALAEYVGGLTRPECALQPEAPGLDVIAVAASKVRTEMSAGVKSR